MMRVNTYEEIEPLVRLCKAGRLFEVQDWISAGKPVNLPPAHTIKRAKQSPLQIAIDLGFYSLVQVLLEGGASLEDLRYPPLLQALHKRRLDLVQLIVKHGADIHSVPMDSVFASWSNETVDFFIEQGADLEKGYPLAHALCWKIRPALGLFMRYKDRYPSFQKQLNIALRHHCKEGSAKWVALTLWAGADPYEKGPDSPDEDDPDEYLSGLELAAFYQHYDIFKMKSVKLDPRQPYASDLFQNACFGDKSDLLKLLLDKGFGPLCLEDKGSSMIQSLLHGMSWSFDLFSHDRRERDIDTSRSREKIKMIHMLVRNGARWEPQDRRAINDARRSLIKMQPVYIMEFVWIMSEYQACRRDDVEALIKNPNMRALLSKHRNRLDELINTLRKS
jgi:hypothetical protein